MRPNGDPCEGVLLELWRKSSHFLRVFGKRAFHLSMIVSRHRVYREATKSAGRTDLSVDIRKSDKSLGRSDTLLVRLYEEEEHESRDVLNQGALIESYAVEGKSSPAGCGDVHNCLCRSSDQTVYCLLIGWGRHLQLQIGAILGATPDSPEGQH